MSGGSVPTGGGFPEYRPTTDRLPVRLMWFGLIRAIRARVATAVAAHPAVAAWLFWVEALLLMTPAEAADRVGVSLSLIYQLCAERRLPHYRVGGDGRRGKLLIDEADLDAFLTACRVEADGLDDSEPLRHIR